MLQIAFFPQKYICLIELKSSGTKFITPKYSICNLMKKNSVTFRDTLTLKVPELNS